MTSPPSIFDLAFNAPPAHPSSLFPGLTGSRIAPPQPSSSNPPSGPPRLSSPRLFRDFFHDFNSDGQRGLVNVPRLPLFREGAELNPVQLAGAIARTSRAVEGVQEAFQFRRDESQDQGEGGGATETEVVDLTDSPPQAQTQRQEQGPYQTGNNDHLVTHSTTRSGAESDFLSTTTHPFDPPRQVSRSRGVNSLNAPVFGYQPYQPGHSITARPRFTSQEERNLAQARADIRRVRQSALRWGHRSRTRPSDQEDQEAVRRQQENHAAWQTTQARARELLAQNLQQPRSRSPSPTPSISEASDSDAPSISPTPSSSASDMSRVTRASRNAASSPVEEIDLTAVDNESAVAATLAKQRSDAIAAQRPDTATENGRTTLTAYKCPVCMETPVNATTTVCGHLFCHQCILETLQWSAKQRADTAVGPRKKHGMCPVCRKLLAIKDVPGQNRTLITLELKFMTRKRKTDDTDPKGKGKGKAKAEDVEVKETRYSKKIKREKRENTEDRLWGNFMNDAAS